jgi:hypothetical protein
MSIKILTIVTAVLLVGVACIPGLHAGIAHDHRLTVEICDPQGVEQKSIPASDMDLQKIEQIFATINARLDKATNDQEKLQVFNDAVKQLAVFGVFGNLSIEQAQRLVTRWYEPTLGKNAQKPSSYLINKNAFCLVSGRTNLTLTSHRFTTWFMIAGYLLLFGGMAIGSAIYSQFPELQDLLLLFALPWFALSLGLIGVGSILSVRADLNRLAVADVFGIGYRERGNPTITYAPGWVKTIGLLGNKTWDGELVGNLPGMKIPLDNFFTFQTYPAVWGFSGIKIWLNEDGSEKSYLGSAILVGLNQKTS